MLHLGDDWAEDHHDIELQNPAGKRLAKARLEEGVAGVARLHELVAQHNDGENSEVVVGDRNRPRTVGTRADRGRLPSIRDQPATSRPVPRTPHRIGSEKRCRRRAHAGGHGAHRFASAPAGSR